MKNIYLIIFSLVCFCTHAQLEETDGEQRWQIIGSKKDGTVFLKLEGRNLYKFSFLNYQFSSDKKIKSIFLNSSNIDVNNLYRFFLKSFDLIEPMRSSFKIDKYEFQVIKRKDDIKISIKSVDLNKIIGWVPFTIGDINSLFAKY